MGKLSRLKADARDLRTTLRTQGDKNPIYVLATEAGKPTLLPYTVNGRQVLAAFGFKTLEEANKAVEALASDQALKPVPMPVVGYLGSLLHHLHMDDIDVLVSDGGRVYPLTTLGVTTVSIESTGLMGVMWDKLLDKSRNDPHGRNHVLLHVMREVLGYISDDPFLFKSPAQCTDEDIVRLVMGKRADLPSVDLGLVWMVSVLRQEGKGTEAVFLKLAPDEDNPPLTIGPMVFSNRAAAVHYDKVLPEFAVKQFAKDAMIEAIRGTEFLRMMAGGFKNLVPEGNEVGSDVVLLDGGCLPLTAPGAAFTESQIERPEGAPPPTMTWETLCAEKGADEMRRMTVLMAARELGIQVLAEPPTPVEQGPDQEAA